MSSDQPTLVTSRKGKGLLTRSRRRLIATLLVGSIAVQFAGCTAWSGIRNNWNYNGNWNGMVMGYRNASNASRAWHRRKNQFCNEKYIKDFARGFKAGYTDVADGSSGCTPAFPPREYWGWKYQSCEGQARVAAWFAGYPHGAKAAEQDGIGFWNQMQTSSNIQHQFADHGLMPSEHVGMYPVPTVNPNCVQPSCLGDPSVLESTMETPSIVPIPDPTSF